MLYKQNGSKYIFAKPLAVLYKDYIFTIFA